MGVWRLEAFRRVLSPILSEILGPALATTFLPSLGYIYGSNGGFGRGFGGSSGWDIREPKTLGAHGSESELGSGISLRPKPFPPTVHRGYAPSQGTSGIGLLGSLDFLAWFVQS